MISSFLLMNATLSANLLKSPLLSLVSISNGEEKQKQKLVTILKTGRVLVRVDPAYYRPTEVELLLGDSTKARVAWMKPSVGFDDLVKEMTLADIEAVRSGEVN